MRCARAIIDALAELGIQVRADLHTGECELVDGDVAGIAIHLGARIGALAEGGEVLVSSTVKDLVVGSELRFTDRGSPRAARRAKLWSSSYCSQPASC